MDPVKARRRSVGKKTAGKAHAKSTGHHTKQSPSGHNLSNSATRKASAPAGKAADRLPEHLKVVKHPAPFR